MTLVSAQRQPGDDNDPGGEHGSDASEGENIYLGNEDSGYLYVQGDLTHQTNDVGGAFGAKGVAIEPEGDNHRAGATGPACAVSARPQPGMMQQPPVQGGPKPPHVRWSRDLTNPFSFAEPSPVPVAVPVPTAAPAAPDGTVRLEPGSPSRPTSGGGPAVSMTVQNLTGAAILPTVLVVF
jgi:hypothetical protein